MCWHDIHDEIQYLYVTLDFMLLHCYAADLLPVLMCFVLVYYFLGSYDGFHIEFKEHLLHELNIKRKC